MNFLKLLWREPWLGPAAVHVQNIFPTEKIDTMGITADGKTLYYNPNYWNSKTEDEKLGLQIHELLHIVNLHTERQGDREDELWNLACDMEINGQIEKAGYVLPKGLAPYLYLSAEEIYDELQKPRKQSFLSFLFDETEEMRYPFELTGDMLSGGENGKTADALLEEDAEELKEIAETASELCGNGSTAFHEAFAPRESQTNWKWILQNLLKSVLGADYDYLSYEFDEFGVAEDLLSAKPVAKICVLVDESGSISDALYRAFLGELSKMENYAEIFVSGFTDDTALSLTPLKKYKRTMSGGTSVLRPYKEACRKNFDCIIILTDGYLDFPRQEPIETIWAMPKCFGRKREVILE